MYRISILLAVCLLFHTALFAQTGTIKGSVTDAKTNEPLIGVNVSTGEGVGTVTDVDGQYEIEVEAGSHKIKFSYIGYSKKSISADIEASSVKEVSVALSEEEEDLQVVVVSASKYEKKLSEETVSIEVLRPQFIENSNATSLDEAMDKVTGVNMIGEQINIRGGSGYQAGAASRVMMLLDGVPLLRADVSNVEWTSLPLENIEQVEIIKGSASALYGSSALNGIVNVITANPKSEPYSKIMLYSGIYEAPSQENLKWWEKPRMFGGGRFAHRKRYGNFDFVVGGAYRYDASYFKSTELELARMNLKVRYRPENIKGLTVGLNSNIMREEGKSFFLWAGGDSLMYTPREVSPYLSRPISIDPYVTYFDGSSNRHSLKTRLYKTKNVNSGDEISDAILYFGEYSFQRLFKKLNFTATAGISSYYAEIVAQHFGEHFGNNVAGFLQLEKELFDRLSLSLGGRLEYYRIDSVATENELELINELFNTDVDAPVKPVVRVGANLKVSEATHLRLSYGQGYRFPTIAEKFVRTERSGIEVFPNPELEPETGWSAELGVNQGLRVSDWVGYVDIAGFVMRYNNLIEFTFGVNEQLGFQSINVGEAKISGIEVSTFGQGELFGLPTNVMMGYTYIYPINLNDTINSGKSNILKYRYQHSAKADVETTYEFIRVGISFTYNSFMENIDRTTEYLVPGIKDWREEHDSGDFVFDVRVGFNITDYAQLSFIAKNVLNRMYTLRPGILEPPRSYTVQLAYEF